MVQVVRHPDREPSANERFIDEISRGLGGGIAQGISGYFEGKKQAKLIEEEDEALSKLGINLQGIKDPEARKQARGELLKGLTKQNELQIEYKLKGEEKKREKQFELEDDKRAYQTVEETFGPTFAKVWKEAPVGGRTELIRQGLDAKMRGQDIEESLAPVRQQMEIEDQVPDVVGEYVFPKIPREQGVTPKEMVSIQKETRKDNMPIFIESQKKLRALAHESDSLNVLDSLNKSGKLPDKMKLSINPSTGQPWGILESTGQVNTETQRFIKTINDFTTQAKDSYGSRVTNFDLQQFMKRLPGLMNTSEGRRQIIEQMKVVNDLNKTYESALKTTFQHYGLDKIPYERAVELAERNIADREETLRQRFNQIESSLDQTQEETRYTVPSGTKITKDTAVKYLKMTGGDKKKAMQMAKDDGYEE